MSQIPPNPSANVPAAPAPTRRVPMFDPLGMRRQMALDKGCRAVLWGLILLVLLVGTELDPSGGHGVLLGLMIIGGIWFWMNLNNARVTVLLARLTPLLDNDVAGAETLLAQALPRWPLSRPLRLALYHRLATLRHRQQRFAEAAAVCEELLTYRFGAMDRPPGSSLFSGMAPDSNLPLGSGPGNVPGAGWFGWRTASAIGPMRANLLLTLLECRLQLHDLAGAYRALTALSSGRLGVVESLQHLALRTRYELAAGYPVLAIQDLPRKISLAELMPAPHSGAFHAMLALAAERAGRPETARWLRQRAELLCTPEQLRDFGLSG